MLRENRCENQTDQKSWNVASLSVIDWPCTWSHYSSSKACLSPADQLCHKQSIGSASATDQKVTIASAGPLIGRL